MEIHSTNYYNSFIEVADDTTSKYGTQPPVKNKKTSAEIQYELIANHPYKYTSDDVFFLVFAIKNNLSKADYKNAREEFYSRGRPCLRTSALTKTYGYGIHCDHNGKVALYGMETNEYRNFISNSAIKKVKALRSKK